MAESAVILGQLFNGVSVASILLLAALGLVLTFGLMHVINMAHGEMLMVGGYLSYLTLKAVHGPFAFLACLLVAFLGAAALGAALEASVIRWLYGRPLDTLLATWGVSLILQQAARSIFGASGVELTAPAWLNHSISFQEGWLAGVQLPYIRIFILVLSAAVLGSVALFIGRSKWGMLLRAVHQDREMAEALGVNTRFVDLSVFALGAGVAGLAGSALALMAPVTPTVGQSYIVYAFLVAIVGGLGSLSGTALAALIVGIFSAMVQIKVSSSTADVLLLLMVVALIQFRPRGLVARGSRALSEA